MLPWCLCLLAIGGLVTREAMHFNANRKTSRLDDLLRAVYRARGQSEEREASLRSAAWLHSERIGIGVSAFDMRTGEQISVSEIPRARQGAHMGFEVLFDFDWDCKAERSCALCLKDRANMLLLMRE